MPWYKRFWTGLLRHIEVWRTAWREQTRQEPVEVPKGKELEFLPAVLEIIETPASPLGRTVGGIVIGLFSLAIIWACFGKVDIIATAQGKIIPSDHSKIIQPLEAGIVTAIHVDEGQLVKRGDLLIELDSSQTKAEQSRYTDEHLAAEVDIARLKALIAGKKSFDVPAGADATYVKLQKKLLKEQRGEHQSRLRSAKLTIKQRKAALQATRLNVSHLEEIVPLLEEKSASMKQMLAQHFVSRMDYLEAEEKRIDKVKELAAQRQQLLVDKAALADARAQLHTVQSEFKKSRSQDLAELETRAKSLSQDLAKATTRNAYQKLTAPIDGVVQQLSVHTIGGVVTAAEQLMVIVPRQGSLEIEAWLQNKDIGFVEKHQAAEIKVEAFPFTKYGTVKGEVTNLSTDAVPLDKVGYVYATRVSMQKSTIPVGNKAVHLTPGMNVTVEVKTGQRRIIEFFLSPILKGFRETARER